MRIAEITHAGGLLVAVNPDDCYTLAGACRLAADDYGERARGQDHNAQLAHLYDPFAALLEGYAVAGAAAGYMRPQDYATFTVAGYMRPQDYGQFTVAGVRAAWAAALDTEAVTRSTAEVAR